MVWKSQYIRDLFDFFQPNVADACAIDYWNKEEEHIESPNEFASRSNVESVCYSLKGQEIVDVLGSYASE
jgi:hypothetical protein